MHAYRDRKPVIVCDGCHKVIKEKAGVRRWKRKQVPHHACSGQCQDHAEKHAAEDRPKCRQADCDYRVASHGNQCAAGHVQT